MLDFRKVIFALSVAGLGLVSTASAQITCAPAGGFSATALTIRAEGMAEQLPALTLGTCSGTTNTASVSFTVTLNAPIGNVALVGVAGGTDAIAMVGGGTGASLTNASSTLIGLPNTSVIGTEANSTTLLFTFATPAAINIGTGASITVSNVRVNVSGLPSGTAITATIAPVSGFTSLAGAGVPLTANAAFTSPTLATSTLSGYGNVAICATNALSVNVVATVKIAENFVGSLTTAAQETTKETAGGANAISASVNTANATGGIVGTTIAVVFNNLIAGVNYYVPTQVTPPVFFAPTGLTLSLVSGPTSTVPIIGSNIGGTTGATISGYPGTAAAVAQLSPVNGSATAYYMVTAADGGTLATTDSATSQSAFVTTTSGGVAVVPAFGTYITSGTGSVASPATVAVSIAGMVNLYEVVPTGTTVVTATPITASTYPVGNASTGYPQFLVPTSPSVLTTKTGLLTGCNTTLIFPYVLTSGGYDTGIEFTNAGPGSTVTGLNTVTTTASGTCTMTAWGASTFGATAIPSFPLTNSPLTIASGTVNAFTLSTALPAADPSFVGYMIATCNFQGAHGFGFVFGGAGGSTSGAGLSYGYLAPILADVQDLNGATTPTSTGVIDQN